MTVYIDILLLINLYINFLLIRVSALLTRSHSGFWRSVAGAAVGSIGSLAIMLPQMNIVLDVLLRALVAGTMTVVAFRFGGVRAFLRRFAVLFMSAFLFAGIMFFLWTTFRPDRLIINNSVVYFDISPIVLIFSSAVCYGVVWVISVIANRVIGAGQTHCTVDITYSGRSVSLDAIVDTGNSLHDTFSGQSVIVIDDKAAQTLLGNSLKQAVIAGHIDESPPRGYRLIAYSSVGANGLMQVFRADKIELYLDKKQIAVNALIGISPTSLDGVHSAIVPAELTE